MSIADANTLASMRATALTEHYQRTVDLVVQAWTRRNRQFLILIAVLAAALLGAFSRPLIAPFLQAVIVGQLSTLPSYTIERLPFIVPLATDLMLALLVVTIFYLMASLCHASGMIINSYVYLGMLEHEVRAELRLGKDQIAFTREGPFFEATGRSLTRLIGFCYKLVLGLLLASFFGLSIYFDWPINGLLATLPSGSEATRWIAWLVGHLLLIVDIVVAIPTLLLFWRYATLSPMEVAEVRKGLAKAEDRAGGKGPAPVAPSASAAVKPQPV